MIGLCCIPSTYVWHRSRFSTRSTTPRTPRFLCMTTFPVEGLRSLIGILFAFAMPEPITSIAVDMFDSEYEVLLSCSSSSFDPPDFGNIRATTFIRREQAITRVYFSQRQIAAYPGVASRLRVLRAGGVSVDMSMPITPMFHVHAANSYVATMPG